MSPGRVHFGRIDQVRGAAALAVVACHFAVSAYVNVPNAGGTPWRLVGDVLAFGYLGVPLFFVVSGLCIHLPQARELAATGATDPDWGAFFRRRFWRLYPPYVTALLVAAVLLLLATGRLPVPWPAIAAQAFLVHTLHPASFDGLNPPAWTLAVEAQLYLVYPVLLALFVRFRAWGGLAIVLAATMAWRIGLNFVDVPREWGGLLWEFFLPRWFEWALGALLAAWAVGDARLPAALRSPWTALAFLGLGVFLEWHAWRRGVYSFKEPIYGIAFAVFVAWLLHGESERDPGHRPGRLALWLQDVGAWSYSLYLLHRPIQLAFEPLCRRVATMPFVVEHRIPTSLLVMAATTPLVMWASRLFYRWCEEPCIGIAKRVDSSRREAEPATPVALTSR